MDNFTLNIYKAFGIYKQTNKPYQIILYSNSVPTDFWNYEEDKGEHAPITHDEKSARQAMRRAVNHVVNNNGNATILPPDGGIHDLYVHPRTNKLTLRQAVHGNDSNDVWYKTYHDLWKNYAEKYGKTFNPESIEFNHVDEWANNNFGEDKTHEPFFNSFHDQSLAARDTQALRGLEYLHKNALPTLNSLGVPMHINTVDLYELPDELHTSSERSLEPQ